jgi:MFS family permease
LPLHRSVVLVRNRARQGGTVAQVDALALHVVQVAAMTLRELSDLVGLHDLELKSARAVCVVAGMIGVLFAGSTVLTPLYVIYKQQFGFSQITLTLIYAVYVIGNLASLLFFGHVSDAIGRRRTAAPAMALAVVSTLIFLLAQGTGWLFVARALSGLAIGIGAGTGTAWLSELIAKKNKARAAMIATSTNFFGCAIGALMSGLLAQYAPWPLHLSFVVYLAALLVTGALVFFAPETVAHRLQRVIPLPDQLESRLIRSNRVQR